MNPDWDTIALARGRLEREIGAIRHDWGGRLPMAVVFPNTYYIGMSNLGLHTIYRLFNQDPRLVCERVFYESDTVPISVESQRPLSDFAALAFSLSFEMDYFNLAEMLRQASIPRLASERGEEDPLLIAGGPCVTANPEPLAPIFDALVIGEGEEIVPTLAEALEERLPRDELLRQLATIPGIYVPSFYRAIYQDPEVEIEPEPGFPYPIERLWVRNLDDHPTTSVILTEETEFGGMHLMEVARGCGRGCRYCLAGFIYRPYRERSLEVLLAQATEGLKHSRKLGLVGAALSDYSQIDALAKQLTEMGAQISVSSLRLDSISQGLLEALAHSDAQTLTIAPETGSIRLSAGLNKPILHERLLAVAATAKQHGFRQLKLYLMVGLPNETDHDLRDSLRLARAIKTSFTKRVIVNLSCFVPKAQTPFQWAPMAPVEILKARIDFVKRELGQQGFEVRSESPREALVQATLARGDRRVGLALARHDGRTTRQWFNLLAREGLELEALTGERPLGAHLPWAVVDSGVAEEYLAEENEKSHRNESTPTCPARECTQCGVCDEAKALKEARQLEVRRGQVEPSSN